MSRNFFNTAVAYVAPVVVVMISSVATAQEFDIVILNGRVMDPETSFDDVRNVGIKDGKIVKITEEAITGKDTINAKDHVVASGFPLQTRRVKWHGMVG